MQDEQEIIAETVNGGRFFFYLISFLLSGILLSFGLVTWLKNPLFALVALIFILPIFFQKRLIIFLTKQIRLIFNDDYFAITLSNCQSGEKINTQDYYYKDVSSCNVTFPQSKLAYSTIKINFVNNEKLSYTLKSTEGDEPKSLSEIIYKQLKRKNHDLILEPAFFASKAGTICIVILGILIAVLIPLHIFYSPKTLPASLLVSISIFANILFRRKNDIDNYKRLNTEYKSSSENH